MKLALPPDVRLDEVLWEPDAAERQALKNWKHAKWLHGRLVAMRKRWEHQDRKHDAFVDQQRRRFSEELNATIAEERRIDDLRAARDREIEERRAFYLKELDKEIEAANKKRREAANAILKRINADTCKQEREALESKGLVRGKRK